ncbi:diguanylate cyclase [Verrucomicrobiota bacterium]
MGQNIPYKRLLDHLSDGVYFIDPARKILYWNKGAERITGYSKTEVMGKHCWDNILVHVDEQGNSVCKGMCPVVKAIKDKAPYETELFLNHKKGHRIPVLVRTLPMFDAKKEAVGAVEIFTDNSQAKVISERLKQLEKLAVLDMLTGLANRHHAEKVLKDRIEESSRYEMTMGVLFIDIDNFKHINDAYGHDAGDQVLKMVAKNLLYNSRSFDLPARWGGDEFIVVSAHIEPGELRKIAERYKVLIGASELLLPDKAQTQRITVSVGATMLRSNEEYQSVLNRADKLMYASKNSGKNIVTIG